MLRKMRAGNAHNIIQRRDVLPSVLQPSQRQPALFLHLLAHTYVSHAQALHGWLPSVAASLDCLAPAQVAR